MLDPECTHLFWWSSSDHPLIDALALPIKNAGWRKQLSPSMPFFYMSKFRQSRGCNVLPQIT
jgi:hypothetical protein